MSTKSLDVFSLRDTVIREYQKFATSFTTIHAPDIREQVDAIYAQNRYWPDPLIQINPSYKRTTTVDRLVANGVLEAKCAEIFRTGPTPENPQGETIALYKHQEEAIALAAQGESFVVTTGTGSGKSLCFFIPIINTVLAEKRTGRPARTRAIVIYPMNALANSQIEELDKFVSNVAGEPPVTFARYTGQEKEEERIRISQNPPDILLTNFMMLELLMTRQDELDRRVMDNASGLRFLVLDELHSYRGRQGADVALLVRRVRERLEPDRLLCIGTSATMASDGSREERNRIVAAVASKLFSVPIPESNVVGETLERVTDPDADAESVRQALGPAIDAGLRADIPDSELKKHPLAVWVETRLGVSWSDVDQRWVRARPLTVREAAQALAQEADRDLEACDKALRELLLVSSVPEKQRTGSARGNTCGFFAFKLHQFISGAGHAYATLEPPGRRLVTVDGQQFHPERPDHRLYPVHFCRECGHEYHPVRLTTVDGRRMFLPRDIDDSVPSQPEEDDEAAGGGEGAADREVFGFLTQHADDDGFTFNDRDEDYPETWLEEDVRGTPRLKPHYRNARPRAFEVAPTGEVGSGTRAWFLPGRFRFCLRCGTTQAGPGRDRNRLASLSAEGRSSATTVLVGSVLRWMHGDRSALEPTSRKLLGFTDNRQDAALQAGHFNDFLFVSLVRAGFLRALQDAGESGLRSEQLGIAQQRALGFDRPSLDIKAEWLLEPALKGSNLQDAEATLRQVLAYRVWYDQRRGWRYTNPNLEQLGLLKVDYLGLDELARDESLFEQAPAVLRNASPSVRAAVYRELFDYMRKWMAIHSDVLEQTAVEQMRARSHGQLRAPWGFGADEKPRRARWLMVEPPSRRRIKLKDTDLILRGGSRSGLGRILRASRSPTTGESLWTDAQAVRKLKAKEFDELIVALLKAARDRGLVVQAPTPFENQLGWRLVGTSVVFRAGKDEGRAARSSENAFFRDYYANLAAMLGQPVHPLFGFEARPHTAQVDGEQRVAREKRFRYGTKEREELAAEEKHLREIGEANRFLPVLFCSPTMELGVDISALNAVYLRNVPPTPANYAQRSGRAGRSGQAALVLTYCSSQGPHDQYFFREPKAMVHGEVRPPLLDLANRDLVESHLSAVWLSCTQRPLASSIADLLVLNDRSRPLKPEIEAALRAPGVAETAVRRIKRVLGMLDEYLTESDAPWYPGPDVYADEVVAGAPGRFARAFDRWRDLFAAAEDQRDASRRTMDNYAAPPKEKRAAQTRHAQALDQLELLQRGSNAFSSDFFTYRYLATEGFLPGYNFPRLPLMAYVPATADGRSRQTYLQRPRFLALSEFGPRSLVYHEGQAYRVVRALLSVGHRDSVAADTQLPTQSVRICKNCGAGHFDDHASTCHSCNAPLDDAEIIHGIYRIENVGTRPAERITANEEERRRQGFELQTTFQWAERDHVLDVRRGVAADDQGPIACLAYGSGATITRLNKGLRRRANRTQLGFCIDPVTGYWAKIEEEEEQASDPESAPRQWIVPGVQDHKNALLLTPVGRQLPLRTLATFQHALLRGIESVFQLEEGEVLAEPMPDRDERGGFLLYEATEGGAGVLTRLVAESGALAKVAQAALEVMHFDLSDRANLPRDEKALRDVAGTSCVAACYRCLLSYYNQPDHEVIDRRDPGVRNLLLRLARSTTSQVGPGPVPRRSSLPPPPGADAALLAVRELIRTRELPRPDSEPLVAAGSPVSLVWRTHYVAASLDPLPDDAVRALDDRGFVVVVLGRDQTAWNDSLSRLAAALGRTS